MLVNINLDSNAAKKNGPLSELLRRMGAQRGLDVGVLIGSKVNNIVEQGLKRGFRSFLFEFNEDIPEARTRQCIELIVDWYLTYLRGKDYVVQEVLSPLSGVVDKISSLGVIGGMEGEGKEGKEEGEEKRTKSMRPSTDCSNRRDPMNLGSAMLSVWSLPTKSNSLLLPLGKTVVRAGEMVGNNSQRI